MRPRPSATTQTAKTLRKSATGETALFEDAPISATAARGVKPGSGRSGPLAQGGEAARLGGPGFRRGRRLAALQGFAREIADIEDRLGRTRRKTDWLGRSLGRFLRALGDGRACGGGCRRRQRGGDAERRL